MKLLHWLFFLVVSVFCTQILASKYQKVVDSASKAQLRNEKSSRVLVSNDFENGVMFPWYDVSPGNTIT